MDILINYEKINYTKEGKNYNGVRCCILSNCLGEWNCNNYFLNKNFDVFDVLKKNTMYEINCSYKLYNGKIALSSLNKIIREVKI